MKLISWNVNGIRSILKKGFSDFVDHERPDILCLQETKAHPEQVQLDLNGYHPIWHSADKKGYSGTAIFSKISPEKVSFGIGLPEHTGEGRVITLEFADFFLVNVYTPNAQRGLTRLDYRMKWDADFRAYLIQLTEKSKPVIFCGDLNVAHKEIDLANPKRNRRNAGFTDEERQAFTDILDAGFVDAFRVFNQDPDQYTWWSYMFNSRAKNIGWRIDYFCVTQSMIDGVKSADIMDQVTGSDHCPIRIELAGAC